MCLAIPMRVKEIKNIFGELADPQVAVVDADGMEKEVRLDLADRIPEIGDYVIVHAGFAIHTLTEQEALINLQLMREMAAALPPDSEETP
ncbi:MAG TPA: HypC/HybG/HupF family hydrogenase formation chaperone [Desulfobulbus sp.]|nr:HypC/HybG/HupF family hydrogenase formation chaperone [Desulfobulbus sp.]